MKEEKSLISRFVVWFSHWSVRWVPDAFIFVLALTVIVFFAALCLTPHGPFQLIKFWVGGFWVLLTFGMQMCVLMLTGFTVADSRQVRKMLTAIIAIPKTRKSTVFLFTLFVGAIWWLHWGIGMMVGIIMGRELVVAKRGMKLDYAHLASISYVCIVCAVGPSMAAQLLLATPGHFMEKITGVIPISMTTFDPYSLALNAILWIGVPLVMVATMPSEKDAVEISEEMTQEILAAAKVSKENLSQLTPAQKMDRSKLFPGIVGLAGIAWIADFLFTKGIGSLDLNTLNFIFVIAGILLHGSAKEYMASVQRGVGMISGVVVQFPFYAGIFGLIQQSGLAHIIAGWFVSISTQHTYPFITFLYSGLLNLFVPSGGSKFVIEAPIIIPAAQELGAYIPWVINAYTFGDEWTNLIQPFWALPIMGAYKLPFKDILPYGFMVMIFMTIAVAVALLGLPLIFPPNH